MLYGAYGIIWSFFMLRCPNRFFNVIIWSHHVMLSWDVSSRGVVM